LEIREGDIMLSKSNRKKMAEELYGIGYKRLFKHDSKYQIKCYRRRLRLAAKEIGDTSKGLLPMLINHEDVLKRAMVMWRLENGI
jgi:hypothetical protein